MSAPRRRYCGIIIAKIKAGAPFPRASQGEPSSRADSATLSNLQPSKGDASPRGISGDPPTSRADTGALTSLTERVGIPATRADVGTIVCVAAHFDGTRITEDGVVRITEDGIIRRV
jgi:hypothetical protein